jgi:hypothetical protein
VDETGREHCGEYSKLTQNPRNRSRWTRPLRFRDREAPGSNPGPPTNFEFKIADFARRRKSIGRREVTAVSQIFLELAAADPFQVDCGRRLNSLTAIAQPIYQHAHGRTTVRHRLQNSKAG